jgi:hypothetical protein
MTDAFFNNKNPITLLESYAFAASLGALVMEGPNRGEPYLRANLTVSVECLKKVDGKLLEITGRDGLMLYDEIDLCMSDLDTLSMENWEFHELDSHGAPLETNRRAYWMIMVTAKGQENVQKLESWLNKNTPWKREEETDSMEPGDVFLVMECQEYEDQRAVCEPVGIVKDLEAFEAYAKNLYANAQGDPKAGYVLHDKDGKDLNRTLVAVRYNFETAETLKRYISPEKR